MNRIQEKMSNRHVQRILSPRSKTNNLNAERFEFEKLQNISICKAVSDVECPVKEKHVRRIIIGTFQEKSSYTFWHIVRTKAPIQDNAISAWKWCQVLHKLLREGYRKVISDSYNYRQWILDTGKMFGLLREGYGKLIQQYCSLLVTKIEFHVRNPKFPGNLVTDEDLESIGENDVNVFFQLSCEMFDFLDEILNLQTAIFQDPARSSSMTNHGQCMLAPLIPCIQDSSQLYDFIVKVLFKLHNVLPASTLDGHRMRFQNQFKILKQFYINSSNLQYFRNLIQIPQLPDNLPNFLLASDISMHVTPVVIVPTQRESPDGIECNVGNLVDLSFADEPSEHDLALVRRESNHHDDNDNGDDFDFHFSSRFRHNNATASNDISNKFARNTNTIDSDDSMVSNLKQKIVDLELNALELERKIVQLTIENQSTVKERDELKSELNNMNVPTDVLNEKDKALEKLNRVKEFYNELREEHVVLLRKKAEVDKELVRMKSDYERLSKETTNSQMNIERDRDFEEQLNALTSKYVSAKEFNNKLLSEISSIKREKDEIETKLTEYKEEKEQTNGRFEFVFRIFNRLVEQLKQRLEKMLEEGDLDNYNLPNMSSSTGYFFERLEELRDLVKEFAKEFEQLHRSLHESSANNLDEDYLLAFTERSAKHCIDFNYHLVYLFFMSKILIQSITNFNTSEKLDSNFKALLKTFTCFHDEILKELKQNSAQESRPFIRLNDELVYKINQLIEMKSEIMTHLSGIESKNLQQLLEQEVNEMDRAIKEAVSKIENLIETSKRQDKDIKLEVNGSILESSSSLMKAVMQLVQDSRELQKEIVMQNKGSANVKEFYQKNHRWTEGLITASKVVAYSAKMLVDSADQVVSGTAEYATLIVASQEIAASTAQLVAASRVKANSSKSVKLNSLLKSSKNVTKSTGDVIATTKNCINLMNQEQNEACLEEELQNLTIHNAKKVEMECQLNIIRLEDELVKERLKLAQLRKIHYHLTE